MQSFKKVKYYAVGAVFTLGMMLAGAGLAHAQVDIVGCNDTTGPNSENENAWDINSNVDVSVDNSADANNDFLVCTDTGLGTIDENTAVGDLRSGDIWGDVAVNNDLNSKNFEIGFLGSDSLDVSVSFANELTGPHSSNENEVNVDSNTDIDINNHTDINNDTDIQAQTGGLDVNHNTVIGDIRTGSIRIDSFTDNIANQNMGDFDLGNLGRLNVSADFSNGLTGPDSLNTNRLDVDNNVDLDVHNTANIDNDTNITANTGDNFIGHNTCVGDVETGSISVGVNISNVAN